MTLNEISIARLVSQNIAKHEINNATEIVSRMGAIQAQDYSMAKWGIGVRLSDTSDKIIEASIDKGEIIRIHVLRPTWHLISADDVYWMLQLSSAKIKSSFRSRHKQLELTEPLISKSNRILEKKLSGEINLTRDELAREFQKVGIKTEANRLSHILFRAEMDGIVCSGAKKNNKLTYALLQERVPEKKSLSRDESLAELARRYFTSRFPATLEDFIWWSNLSISDARKGLNSVKSDFYQEKIGNATYLVPVSFSGDRVIDSSLHLLPAYDEFLISYKDRSSALSSIHNKKTVSDNGIFYPSIVVDGQVAGLWKRTIRKNKVIIETDFFKKTDKFTISLLNKKAISLGNFLDKATEIVHNNS